jgi:hypothetical protein
LDASTRECLAEAAICEGLHSVLISLGLSLELTWSNTQSEGLRRQA